MDIVSVFEAVGARAQGGLTDAELALIERNACPTEGSCAGMFTAHAAIELYAEVFEAAGRLDRLQPFASHFGEGESKGGSAPGAR